MAHRFERLLAAHTSAIHMQAQRPEMSLQVDMQLKSASLELHSDNNEASLARFAVSHVSASYSQPNDSNKHFELHISQFKISDTRKNTSSVFTEILLPDSSKEDQLLVRFIEDPSAQSLQVQFRSPRIFIALDVLTEIKVFLEVAYVNTECSGTSETVGEEYGTYTAPVEPSTKHLQISCNIVEPEIVIVNEEREYNSDAIVLRAQGLFYIQDKITRFHGKATELGSVHFEHDKPRGEYSSASGEVRLPTHSADARRGVLARSGGGAGVCQSIMQRPHHGQRALGTH